MRLFEVITNWQNCQNLARCVALIAGAPHPTIAKAINTPPRSPPARRVKFFVFVMHVGAGVAQGADYPIQ
ncbi:hypothetical protein HBN68_00645 [Pseudomonas sp. WS 5078]|nr:hypothetical protein [Pseudomonas sp. WS 5078]NMY58294.1 hypothetical protein [Pseudomonas sp. WS 5354]